MGINITHMAFSSPKLSLPIYTCSVPLPPAPAAFPHDSQRLQQVGGSWERFEELPIASPLPDPFPTASPGPELFTAASVGTAATCFSLQHVAAPSLHTAASVDKALGTKNIGHIYTVGYSIMGSNESEEDLGVMVDNQSNMSSQYTAVAKRPSEILSYTNRNLK